MSNKITITVKWNGGDFKYVCEKNGLRLFENINNCDDEIILVNNDDVVVFNVWLNSSSSLEASLGWDIPQGG